MSFWDTASTEQRLAQIDAGIELGMTRKQIAMCLGAPLDNSANALGAFANRHGRSFPVKSEERSRAGKRGGLIGGLANARRSGAHETDIKGAFSIFGHSGQSFEIALFDEGEAA